MDAERFTWDERKRAANLRKHGVDFAIAERFEFDTALIVVDDRKNYGEVRYRAIGMIDDRLHVLIFTARGALTRIISLRRANDRERANHAATQEAQIDS
jgi:uncharacterized DUF497 family protein